MIYALCLYALGFFSGSVATYLAYNVWIDRRRLKECKAPRRCVIISPKGEVQ